jgi:hypothetical protein
MIERAIIRERDNREQITEGRDGNGNNRGVIIERGMIEGGII